MRETSATTFRERRDGGSAAKNDEVRGGRRLSFGSTTGPLASPA
jgi:hypothetical protein